MNRLLIVFSSLSAVSLIGCGKIEHKKSKSKIASHTSTNGTAQADPKASETADAKPSETADPKTQDPTVWQPSIASFLDKEDLLPRQKLKPLTAEQAKASLAEADLNFYSLNERSNDDQNDGDPACDIDELLDAVKLTLRGKAIYWHFEFDSKGCENLGIDHIQMTSDFAIECEHGDLSAFDGKTTKESQDISDHCGNGKIAFLGQNRMFYRSSFTDTTHKIELEGNSFDAQSTKDGLPCIVEVHDGVTKESDDCQNVSINSTTLSKLDGTSQPDQIGDVYRLIKNSGLVASGKKDPWYSSGSREITINQWQGRVDYQSATTAPTYTLQYKDQTLKGTLAELEKP